MVMIEEMEIIKMARKTRKKMTLAEKRQGKLLDRKSKLEGTLENNFAALSYFVDTTEGTLIQYVGAPEYSQLTSSYEKSFNAAEALNKRLCNGEGIWLDGYKLEYRLLLGVIEERNRDYINEITANIRDSLSERELKMRAGLLVDEEYVVSTVAEPFFPSGGVGDY